MVSEAIQTLMRRYGLPNPYETLKELTRGRVISRQVIDEFVAQLPLNDEVKERLRRLTPQNYVGLAAELVDRFTPSRSRTESSRPQQSRPSEIGLFDAIHSARAIRQFRPDPVPHGADHPDTGRGDPGAVGRQQSELAVRGRHRR